MPLKCCVPRCRSNYKSERLKYISCFLFPKDPKLVEQWLKNIGRPNFTPTSNSVVCIKHFTGDCILWKQKYDKLGGNVIKSTKKAILKPYSCPTIFETRHRNYLEKQQSDQPEIISLLDEDEDQKQPLSNSAISISQPKRPRFQYILPKSKALITLSPEANRQKIVIFKDTKQPLPQSEPEIITPEVTLEDTVINAIYNRRQLWIENDSLKPEELDKLWAEVAREVRRSVDIVKVIWQHLQMKFFEELIKLEKFKSKTSSWPYFERLRFLKLDNHKLSAINFVNSSTKTPSISVVNFPNSSTTPSISVVKSVNSSTTATSFSVVNSVNSSTAATCISAVNFAKSSTTSSISAVNSVNSSITTSISAVNTNSSTTPTSISTIPVTVEEISINDTSNEQKLNNNQSNGTVKEPKIWCKSATSLGLISQNHNENTEDDLTFFNNLLPRVKLLSNRNKKYFRQKMLAVLKKIENR